MLRRHQVRSEVKQRLVASLNKCELVLHSFGRNELKDLKMDATHNEFELHGLMFDIIYTVETSDSIKYWCWPDHQETSLNHRLDLLANQEFGCDKKSRGIQRDLLHFLSLLFFETTDQNFPQLAQSLVNHRDLVVHYNRPYSFCETPPPRA